MQLCTLESSCVISDINIAADDKKHTDFVSHFREPGNHA